jgi:hypothetical protein
MQQKVTPENVGELQVVSRREKWPAIVMRPTLRRTRASD